MAITAKEINLEFIRNYCSQEDSRRAWYNAEVQKTVPCAVFPKGADGKKDRSQQPTIENRKITFIQIKQDFIAEYFPELAPKKKEKKVNMYTPL